ncbi:hypothetical protein GGI12_001689 [Dipsacomyces acuminosporus]|nr:hypothetical protein GGI12_001689 [Dipsacomyces acuminosporus]
MVYIEDQPNDHSSPAHSVQLKPTAENKHGVHRVNTASHRTSQAYNANSDAISPLVPASTKGEQYPAQRLSYAHQRSQSGWEKVFQSMSERAEGHPAESDPLGATKPGHLEGRIPGIGEDSVDYEDVQYVDESDDEYQGPVEYTKLAHVLNGSEPDGVSPGHRGRSNTGASSTGSAIQYDHGLTTSTTALSPHYELPEEFDGADDIKANGRAKHDDEDDGSSGHFRRYLHSLHIHTHHSRNSQERRSEDMQRGDESPSMVARIFHPSKTHPHDDTDGDGDDDDAEGGTSADEKAKKSKRMEELRHKFKRAVVKASVMTRKPRRRMKSSFPDGMFPFLQDAVFAPMFYFMRDEHGHRAPPVIFDAIKLAVTVSGTMPDDDDHHHFVVRIELQYGDIKWVIYRKLNDFLALHTMLTLRKFQGRVHQLPTFPQQFSYALEKAKSFKPGSNQHREERMHQAAADRRHALENYLIKVLRAMNMKPAYEVCTFLELSAVSIVKDVGWKGKEGNLDRRVEHTTGQMCMPHDLRRWSRQWVIVRDSYIAFCNHISDPYPSDVLFADPQFDIKFRKKTGRNPLHPYRITISNEYRRIQLRSDSERVINEWKHSITQMKNSSAWAVPHRFSSFAPIREDSRVIWFVDGDDYFYALSEALENATDCIYIEDWWLSPELHLRRPYAQNEEYRLDRLLKRKAEEGVKIFVVVYKEVTVSLTINSSYTKRKLQSLHPNIMVQRHPDHLAGGTMFWAHHEKMVIVDNTFAFIGGLDLCWGRYDTHGHRLADYFLPCKGKVFSDLQNFFGQDYNNARIHDFANVNNYEGTLIDRRVTSRMPWHDVHMAMIGQPARDVARHFIMRWNFIKSSKGMAKSQMPFLMPKGEYSISRNDQQYRGTCRTQVLRSSAEWSLGISKESSIHTAYCEMIRDAKHFIYIENQFFITNAREDPSYSIKNRIAEALVDRIKRAHKRKEKFRVIVLMPLMPAFEGDVNAAGAATLKLVMHWQYQSICRGDHSIAAQLEKEGIDMRQYINFFGLRTYDVIRRYTDDFIEEDISALAGNAPQEVAGFDQLLEHEGIPAIEKKSLSSAHASVHSPEPIPALASAPTSAPILRSSTTNGIRPSFADRDGGGNRTETMPRPSFSSPRAARASGDYSFRRPDEAFAADILPMENNISRQSQEISRRSEHMERPRFFQAAASSKNSQFSNVASRRSFTLPRRQLNRRRSSFSGIRNLHSKSQATDEESHQSTHVSDDEAMRTGYIRSRMDNEGRRMTALRYLVRGTEHIKHYGKNMKSGGTRLQRKFNHHGLPTELERRDSDSELAGSHMQLDMADVDNYIHPPSFRERSALSPAEPVFLGHQANGKAAERGKRTILPEMVGAEYAKLCREAEARIGSTPSGTPTVAAASVAVSKHNRAKSSVSKRINGTARKASTKGPLANDNYLYPPKLRNGPQIIEHEVFGKPQEPAAKAPASVDVSSSTPTLQPRSVSTSAAGASQRLNGETPQPAAAEPEVVDQVVTELVYIHCKLMIVDDRYVIMGSANINDRSMVGNRDSEIAMVVEDTEPVLTTMNGRPYQAAKFAHSLRVQLCQEHTGVLDSVDQMRYINEMYAGKPPIDTKHSEERTGEMKRAKKFIEDPLSDEFIEFWWNTAVENERVFRDVFRCVPDDTIETFDQYKSFIPGHEVPHGHAVPGKSTVETLEKLKAVKGHLVPIPLNFLKYENLGAKLGDKEILLPQEVFT